MFLFSGKKNAAKLTDVVWISQTAKWNGILEEWKKDSHLSIVCWFDKTQQQLETVFAKETRAPVSIFLAGQMHTALLTGSQLIFAEHYPLYSKEAKLFEKLSLKDVTVHSSLDEPLFVKFNGERVSAMMKQMGMKENESVQHKLVSSAIRKAQDKIEKKVVSELLSTSAEEWMRKNIPAD
ncbi:MAG: hypothetical protein ABI480_11920 [Chitinophagaceae bacterium]